jgi:forkhead box protein K
MLIARVTARLRVRLRARVISSAACRWFSCGGPAGDSAVPCSSRGRVSARVRARAKVRVRARVRARARVRKSAIARRGWWGWVLCGVWVVY